MAVKNFDTVLNNLYQYTCIGLIILAFIIGGLGLLDLLSKQVAVPLIIFAIIEFALTLGIRLYQSDVKKSSLDRKRIFYNWIGVTAFLIVITILAALL
ncbi:MAG: hypothetical protein QW327_02830 [Candidatus Odinarchaeota archaeon]